MAIHVRRTFIKFAKAHLASCKLFLCCLFVLFVLGSVPARSETIIVEAQGNGSSQSNAISSALIAAIEQVSGAKIETNSNIRQELSSVSNGSERKTDLYEKQQIEVFRQTGGIVRSYDVISIENSGDGSFSALLRVSIERYSTPGLPTGDRRRIVVVLPTNLVDASPAELALLRDALNSYLVESRRFAVLDRENDSAYRKEMDLLHSPDVPIEETVRVGQMIGADYLLLSQIRELKATSREEVKPITRDKVTRKNAKLSCDFKVIEVASRQIKWSGQAAAEVAGDREAAVRAAASEIGEKVVNAIFPLRVVQIVGRKTFVINQGSDTIKVWQDFLANMLGEPTIDPYTKEPLGRAEIPIGTVRISRVDPKLSYGELVSGTLPDGEVDLVLRPSTAQQAQSKPSGVPKTLNPRARPLLGVFPAIARDTARPSVDKLDTLELTQQVEEALHATRRFTIFERSAEILQNSVLVEQEFAKGGQALKNAAEAGKLVNVKFIAQPTIMRVNVSVRKIQNEENPGQYRYEANGSLNISIKVLDTESAEIAFETTRDVILPPGNQVGARENSAHDEHLVLNAAWHSLASDAAMQLANAVVGSLFPTIQVVRAQDGDIFVNLGESDGVSAGQSYQVFSIGEPLIDPATKEKLGYTEKLLGEVEIVRVNPRFSVARAKTPLTGEVKPGDVLRPPP